MTRPLLNPGELSIECERGKTLKVKNAKTEKVGCGTDRRGPAADSTKPAQERTKPDAFKGEIAVVGPLAK